MASRETETVLDSSPTAYRTPTEAGGRQLHALLQWAWYQGLLPEDRLAAAQRLLSEQRARTGRLAASLVQAGLIDRSCQAELREIEQLCYSAPDFVPLRRLGVGAVGAVYLARDRRSGSPVALKVMHATVADQPGQRELFRQEAEALSRLRHPAIPALVTYGTTRPVPYMAMEYVGGFTLQELMEERGAYPEAYVLWVAAQVAHGLRYAAASGIVHRDVKPQNIIVQVPPGGSEDRIVEHRYPVKIIDFGLAAAPGGSGQMAGTPRYMSPEQVRGARDLDWRSDCYSLGATMFHLLTERPPFLGDNAAMVMNGHLVAPVPDPRSIVPYLDRSTTAIVKRAMAKSPSYRFESWDEFIEACERAGRGLQRRRPSTDQWRRRPATGRAPSTSAATGDETGDYAPDHAVAAIAADDSTSLEVPTTRRLRRRAPAETATERLQRVARARARGEISEIDLPEVRERRTACLERTTKILNNDLAQHPVIGVRPWLAVAAATLLVVAAGLHRLLF